jgi:hypothetical protein
MWVYYNPNPIRRDPVGDCTVRALSKALDIDWEQAHVILDYNSYMMGDISNANAVMAAVLRKEGFYMEVAPECPMCYTAEMFCEDHPYGIFVLGFGNHVATVIDGEVWDAWDSTQEIPIYYFYKKD